jgi:membrane protease YdiL (CAAX protease family)
LEALAFSLAFALICAVLFLLARAFDRRISRLAALATAAYLGLDDLVTGLPSAVRSLQLLPGHWNWTGKILSLGLSLLTILILRLRPADAGLTLRWRNGRLGVAALGFFIVWGASLGLLFRPGAPDAETLAFQATMPGLAEELVYRGLVPAILLAALLRRAAPGDEPATTPWAAVLATALAFGVWHGLSLSRGRFGFEILSALFPFLGSIAGGWLRFRTRSLVFPIAAHSLANVAFHLAGGLRA